MNEYVRKAVLTVPQTAIFHFYHLRTRDSLKKGWVALMVPVIAQYSEFYLRRR